MNTARQQVGRFLCIDGTKRYAVIGHLTARQLVRI
jgi:hypothetical protein